MKINKILCAVFCAFVFCAFLCSCAPEEDDKRPKMNIDFLQRDDGSSYMLRDGSEQYCYQVEAGESGEFTVTVEKTEGSLDLRIYSVGNEEEPIYTGTDLPTCVFKVKTDVTGDYRVYFTAHKFVGEYNCDFIKK